MNNPPPSTHAGPPRRGRLAALVAINAVLACALLAGLLTQRAAAQPGGNSAVARARGNYLMVSGAANGVNGHVVYIVDTVNQELLALRYQRAAGRLDPLGYRSLAADSGQGAKTR